MDPRDEWDHVLERELRRKFQIIKEAPARPSEKLIQHKLKYYGNMCHETWDVIDTSQREYANLLHSYDEFLKDRAGGLHFYVKLKALFYEHKQRRHDILKNTENFVMAHEWYEILVAANEAEELSRLAFLEELNKEVYDEPTRPENPAYPSMEQVHRDYSKETVTRMARSQLRRFDALLEEEWATKEEIKDRVQRSQEQDDKTLSDLKARVEELRTDISSQNRKLQKYLGTIVSTVENLGLEVEAINYTLKNFGNENEALRDLKVETENLKEETKEEIVHIKNELQRNTSRILESINEKHVALLTRIEKIYTSPEHGEQDQEDTTTTESPEQIKRKPMEREQLNTKRKHPETPTVDKARQYERRLRHHKEQLQEIDKFLRENIVRERHFGERRMRSREHDMRCVYCGDRGAHYSDACPVLRTVDERIDLLREENRCLKCLEQHGGEQCRKGHRCYYCNFNKPEAEQQSTNHHGSICRRPEEFARAMKRRRMVNDEIEHCCQRLDELGTDKEHHARAIGTS